MTKATYEERVYWNIVSEVESMTTNVGCMAAGRQV